MLFALAGVVEDKYGTEQVEKIFYLIYIAAVPIVGAAADIHNINKRKE